MRSGAKWVSTDYDSTTNQSQCFEFTATAVPNSRKVKIDWWMTTYSNDSAASPTYYLCRGVQKLVVDGVTQVNWSGTNPKYTNSSGATVYYGYADKGSWLDNHYGNKEFFDTNGDYTGIRRWVKVLGTRWKTGSFTKEANAAGSVSFSVSGNFGWYSDSIRLGFSKTFTISNLISPATYTIKYLPNSDSFVSGNSALNMPSNGTKTYDKSYTISSTKPTSKDDSGEVNYTFVTWVETPNTSFGGSGTHAPNSSYTTNKALTLYAQWSRASKTVTFDFNGGQNRQGNTQLVVSTVYDTDVKAPYDTEVYMYGYTLSRWDSSKGAVLPGAVFKCRGVETFTANWSANKYTIHLADKDGKVMQGRDIEATYDAVLYGDFSYKVPGYKVLGWSVVPMSVRSPGDPELNILPNIPLDNAHRYPEGIYMGVGDFSTNAFVISDTEKRRHMAGQEITLYPILEYSTSMYVYTTNGWKLAMPYVYTTNGWKQSMGNIYTTKWTK